MRRSMEWAHQQTFISERITSRARRSVAQEIAIHTARDAEREADKEIGKWDILSVQIPCETNLTTTCLCQPVQICQTPKGAAKLARRGALCWVQCAGESVKISGPSWDDQMLRGPCTPAQSDKGEHERCRSVKCTRPRSTELVYPLRLLAAPPAATAAPGRTRRPADGADLRALVPF